MWATAGFEGRELVNGSFAPSGLDLAALRTHGLRRGLYSCAATRLLVNGSFAPSGLDLAALRTHGLRRGLYSGAASRLVGSRSRSNDARRCATVRYSYLSASIGSRRAALRAG
jgi:hypothetical protein